MKSKIKDWRLIMFARFASDHQQAKVDFPEWMRKAQICETRDGD